MRTRDDKLRELVAEQAAEWHVAQSEGHLSPQQARAFMRWLRASPTHVAEYLAIAGIAGNAADAARASSLSLDDLLDGSDDVGRVLEWKGGAARREPHPHGRDARSRRGATRRRSWARRALACAALVLVAGVVLVAAQRYFAPGPMVRSYSAAHGEQQRFRLPDGTLVRLDSDSSLTIRYGARQRQVTLDQGQAYFDVAADSTRPFSVMAGNSLIRDIGTVFDVYRKAQGTTITVASGRVQVWNASSARPIGFDWFGLAGPPTPRGKPLADLGAGQELRMTAAGSVESLSKVDVSQALAWTRGEIAFDNRPIAAVAAEFNRYNDVQISVAGSNIGSLPISGTFGTHDVTTFVAFLESMPGVRVERRGQQIVIGASHAGESRQR